MVGHRSSVRESGTVYGPHMLRADRLLITSRDQRCATGGANAGRSECILIQDRLLCKAVEGRSSGNRIAIDSNPRAHVLEHYQENVRPPRFFRRNLMQGSEQEQCQHNGYDPQRLFQPHVSLPIIACLAWPLVHSIIGGI